MRKSRISNFSSDRRRYKSTAVNEEISDEKEYSVSEGWTNDLEAPSSQSSDETDETGLTVNPLTKTNVNHLNPKNTRPLWTDNNSHNHNHNHTSISSKDYRTYSDASRSPSENDSPNSSDDVSFNTISSTPQEGQRNPSLSLIQALPNRLVWFHAF